MTKARVPIALTITAAVVGATLFGATGAGAAPYTAFFGYAGGSQVRAADATITSDLTVQSTVFTVDSDSSDTKHTVNLSVDQLLTAQAISTTSTVRAVAGGREVTSTARATGVKLLGGLISIDAVTTTSTASKINGKFSADASTTLAGVHLPGRLIPLDIPKNFTVGIPGIATVTLNAAAAGTNARAGQGIGIGVAVSLLKSRGDSPLGTTVYLTPTMASVASGDAEPTGHSVGGRAFATSVDANVGSGVSVTSSPTASSQIPFVGTDGEVLQAKVAGVQVGTALVAGAGSTTAQGINTTSLAEASTTSALADVSLLGGVIKVRAVTARAHAKVATGQPLTTDGASSIVGLTIAGIPIYVNAAPNTTISLGTLGSLVVNEQIHTSHGIAVNALHVTLNISAYGLKAGAQITVAHADATAQ